MSREKILNPLIIKVPRLEGLLLAIQRGAEAAYFTPPPPPPFNWNLIKTLKKSIDGYGKFENIFWAQYYGRSYSINRAINDLRGEGYSSETIQDIKQMLTYIYEDIQRIMRTMPDYVPESILFYCRDSYPNSEANYFHKDVEIGDRLRLVRVYQGPSTKYWVHGEPLQQPPDGSVMLHTTNSKHAIPRSRLFQSRIAVIATLEKKE